LMVIWLSMAMGLFLLGINRFRFLGGNPSITGVVSLKKKHRWAPYPFTPPIAFPTSPPPPLFPRRERRARTPAAASIRRLRRRWVPPPLFLSLPHAPHLSPFPPLSSPPPAPGGGDEDDGGEVMFPARLPLFILYPSKGPAGGGRRARRWGWWPGGLWSWRW
jgi:hypothetical protein